jgi:parallel beta-helix repeat protein
MKLGLAPLLGLFCVVQAIHAATRYVDVNSPTSVAPYTSWGTAATNIQDAINSSFTGDTILVADGIYRFGNMIVGPANNRIYTGLRTLTIQSVNGPEVTIIKGAGTGSGIRCATLANGSVLSGFTLMNGMSSYGGGGVFCQSSDCLVTNCILTANTNSTPFYPGGGAFRGVLVDCLLTNNVSTSAGGGAGSNTLINCTLVGNRGGGAYGCSLSNCLLIANVSGGNGGGAVFSVLNNCIASNNAAAGNGGGFYLCTASDSLISSNRATGSGGGAYSNILNNCVLQENFGSSGGGAYGGVLINCIIVSNSTSLGGQGGGAKYGILKNCLLTGNAAYLGAGIADVVANNCTIVGNVAIGSGYGAGSYYGQLNNSIIYYNEAGAYSATYNSLLTNCCASSLPLTFTANSFTNEPRFVDAINGDFHLQSDSPCINAGNNSLTTNTNDLDGNPQIVGGTVDVGAYEYQYPSSALSYAWLLQYGLPNDSSADFSDDDSDGMNNWQEWIAGTDPTDTTSLLQMYSATPANDSSGVNVSWQSVSGKMYLLQRSTDLSVFSTVQSNITGQAGTTSYKDTSTTGNGPFFYRVGAP